MESLPLGEISAIGSAFLWALNAVMLRPLTGRLAALRITALQYALVSLFIMVLALALGRLSQAAAIPLAQGAGLVGAALVGMGVGDTSYVRALGALGVARSFTFATSGYVLLTSVLAALFLAEPVTLKTIAGAVVLLLGMWIVVRAAEGGAALPEAVPEALEGLQGLGGGAPLRFERLNERPPDLRTGLAFCVLAAVCWAFTASVLKVLLVDVDVLAANTIRIPAVALMLNAVSLRYHRFDSTVYRPRTVLRAGLAGALGLGIGSLLFLYAIQEAGAAKTAILSSTSPLFAATLAPALLRERLTRALALGTVLSVVGTWLVV